MGAVGKLELILTAPKGTILTNKVVIVCHPHPQYGGTMDNKVVTTLMRVYRDLGVGVIRFNFRGVGNSEGEYAEAVGEIDDLLSVIRWLRQQEPRVELLLAGFSFGSYVAYSAVAQLEGILQLTLVAPPIGKYPFGKTDQPDVALCVIQGVSDEIVDVSVVDHWFESLTGQTQLIKIEDAGHFFHGKLTEFKRLLAPVVSQFLK